MTGPASEAEGIVAAQARLEMLFRALDRLTPDELARIGYRPALDDEREALLAEVDAAAERTGRTALVDRARELAAMAVMRRFGEGALHPTWLGLNWGLSSGSVDDRVAIAEILADAAAAVVVEDALDPGVAEALRLDGADILGPAGTLASEGALGRMLAVPSDPALGPSPASHALRLAAAAILAGYTFFTYVWAVDARVGAVLAVLGGIAVVAVNRHRGRRVAA
jgi:hypothetical protein